MEAINDYLKCIEINDNEKIYYYNLGLVYLELNDLEQSLNYLNKTYELDNTFYQALLKSGEVLLQLKKYDESIDIFDKILKLENEKYNELALLRKGDALFMKQKFKEALELYEKVILINDKNEEAFVNIGICKRKLFEINEAINYYDKALKINNNNENTILNKAIALSYKGDNEEANNLLEREKELNNSENLLYTYALLNLNNKNYSKVNELFDNYINSIREITNAGIYNIKAQALYEEEKYEEALKYIEKALDLNPNYNYALNTKANILDKLGKKEESLIWYQKAAESKPENIIFLLNYCLSLLENKNIEKSKIIFDNVKQQYKLNLNGMYNEQEINFIEKNIQKLEVKFKKMKL